MNAIVNGAKSSSSGKRLLLAVFLAFAAGGVTSYLFAAVGMVATVLTSGRNSADIPEFNIWLRAIALPIAVMVGILVFVIAFRRTHETQGAATDVHRHPAP